METMGKIFLYSLFFMICLSGISGADTPNNALYYPGDNLIISPGSDTIISDNTCPPIEEFTGIIPLMDQLHLSVISLYSRIIDFPSVFVTESVAIFFILLGGGALTLLVNRWKVPEDPESRPAILYNTIKEHPGATLSELQKLTGHSRGSVTANLHRLDMTAKIQKSVRDGRTRYYIASIPEDEIKGFLRKVASREKSQKIFEAIISTPGISQKELHETTGIPKTTLQWHLTQLARYEAIKRTRDRNTVHYSAIPDYILLYNHILGDGKQNRKTIERQEPNNNSDT